MTATGVDLAASDMRPRALGVLATAPDEALRGRSLERFSTARETRICHEVFVGVERIFALIAYDALPTRVRQEPEALLVVLEIGDHDLVEHLAVNSRVRNRTKHFDAAVEIARHEIGR